MTAKPECCGSCRRFGHEDALGLGWCALIEAETTCGGSCNQYENKQNNHNYESKNKKDR